MKYNPLTKYKINSNDKLVDTYRVSYIDKKEDTEAKQLSPFEVFNQYANIKSNVKNSYYIQSSLQNIVKQIDPKLLKSDNENVYNFHNDNQLFMTYLLKSLTKKSSSTYTIRKNNNTMYCSLPEIDACDKLPIIINHNCNVIACCTRIQPGNTVFINPENIKHLCYDNVIFPYDIGFIGTINNTISVYSYNEIPKNKVIVSLLSEDVKRNLFQIIDDKIIFMENDENSLGNFFDSISIIDIVYENLDENVTEEINSDEKFDTITLNGTTYKLVPM